MAFQDRIVQYPGRVTLTPAMDENQAVIPDTFDVTRAEGTITRAGTPLNAANLNTEINATVQAATAWLSNIGRVYSAAVSRAITTASIDNHVLGASVTLPAGTYVITGRWTFAAPETGLTDPRNIQVSIGPSASNILMMERVFVAQSNYAILTTSTVYTFSAQTVVYVMGSSSVPGRNAQVTQIDAVRIL